MPALRRTCCSRAPTLGSATEGPAKGRRTHPRTRGGRRNHQPPIDSRGRRGGARRGRGHPATFDGASPDYIFDGVTYGCRGGDAGNGIHWPRRRARGPASSRRFLYSGGDESQGGVVPGLQGRHMGGGGADLHADVRHYHPLRCQGDLCGAQLPGDGHGEATTTTGAHWVGGDGGRVGRHVSGIVWGFLLGRPRRRHTRGHRRPVCRPRR